MGTASGTGPCTITVSGAGMGDVTGAGYEVSGGTTSGTVVSSDGWVNCVSCTGKALTTSTGNNLIFTFMNPGGPYTNPSPFTYDIAARDSLGFNVGAGHYMAGTYRPTWTNAQDVNSRNVSLAIPHP